MLTKAASDPENCSRSNAAIVRWRKSEKGNLKIIYKKNISACKESTDLILEVMKIVHKMTKVPIFY
jgi:hypothetical protein